MVCSIHSLIDGVDLIIYSMIIIAIVIIVIIKVTVVRIMKMHVSCKNCIINVRLLGFWLFKCFAENLVYHIVESLSCTRVQVLKTCLKGIHMF